MEHAIVIQDVTKRFRETVAVSHVTACFETGEDSRHHRTKRLGENRIV